MPIRLNDDEMTDIDIKDVSPIRHIVRRIREESELKQEESSWCWAACTELIVKMLNQNEKISQCLLAKQFANPGGVDCCQIPGGCNNPVNADSIERIYDHYGVKTTFQNITSLTEEQIKDLIKEQIDSPNPSVIEALYSSGEDSQHVVIIYGWSNNEDNEMSLLIKDPWGSADDGAYTFKEVLVEKGWIGVWTGFHK